MTLGILDEYDKSIPIPSSMTIPDAIGILNKMENYIPSFFSKKSQGNRIIDLYRFEKDDNAVLVTIPICDCEQAVRQYKDYTDGMYELVTSDDEDSFDIGTMYDRDVVFINDCFDGSDHNYSANVGQALNQFECLLNLVPDIKKIKERLSGLMDSNSESPYIGIYCHSICSFYKRLIKEILKTYVSLDSAQKNPRKYIDKPVIESKKIQIRKAR